MEKDANGFTLVELLIAIAILSLVLVIALPSFRQFTQSEHVRSTVNSLHSALLLARSEAVKRGVPVFVDNEDEDWASGWIVYADLNGSGSRDASDALISEVSARPEGVIAAGNTPVSRYIRYIPTGHTRKVGGALQLGTVSVCHASGEQPIRKLKISSTGRPRIVVEGAGDCSS